MVYIPFFSSAWEPKGQHVLITGGSQGLGMALGVELARMGADITLVARSETKLEKAAQAALDARASTSQKISFYSSDVSSFAGAKEALEWSATSSGQRGAHIASAPIGRIPDTVFACAGGSVPGYFLDQTEETFKYSSNMIYETALATAHASATLMAKNGVKGKIVFVSSFLGLTSFIGYASYAPHKFAIRGLATTLRSELQMYGITVNCYFPGTILTPGYEAENRTKPAITKKIEDGGGALTAEQCSAKLIKGLQRDHFFITSDFESELLRVESGGHSVPSNYYFIDGLIAGIGRIAFPVWRKFIADRSIKKYAQEHSEEVGLPSLPRDS